MSGADKSIGPGVQRHDKSDMCAQCARKPPDEPFCAADEYLAALAAALDALEQAYPHTRNLPPPPRKPWQEWGDGTRIWRGPAFPDPWGNHPRDRWVRVMADLCADGVWNVSGAGGCCEELPISRALVDRIRAWQSWYDRREIEAHRGGECTSLKARDGWHPEEFAAEGLAIAKSLKAELGPGWKVIYYDRAAAERSEPRCTYPWGERYAPRGDFEYRIE